MIGNIKQYLQMLHLNHIYKILILILVIGTKSVSWAIISTGTGITYDHALNNAFQNAIQTSLGAFIQSESIVENLILIQDEIVTHSKGYVTNYKIIKEKRMSDGSYMLTVDTNVNKKLMIDDAQTLEILMKMTGHPRLILFGVDDDFNSVPVTNENFDLLVHFVSEIFSQKFKFEVIDLSILRTKYQDIEGLLDQAKVIKYNHKLKADYMITVKLNCDSKKNIKLVMSSVRISDNFLLGKIIKKININVHKDRSSEFHKIAISAAKNEIFASSIKLARVMLENMQTELDRGKGFRYTITYQEFPDLIVIKKELTEIRGYVRYLIKRENDTNMEITYWSNLKTKTLVEQIRSKLTSMGHKYKYKIDGRTLKFKWQDPDWF